MAKSSSGKLLARLVEIEVKSAALSTEQKGNFYVKISVSEDQGLRTKPVNCSNDYNPSWNQKFVFSVARDFISDKKSMVCFTVFRARRYIPDLAIGQAVCEVGAMFPVDECMKDESNSYHTDDDGGEYYNEPEIQEREAFEVRAVVGVPILKGESEMGRLNVSLCAWEKYFPYELNLNGRLKKTYPIIKGSDKVGRLIMQRASSQNKCLWMVGDVKFRNLAMELEEFMKQREIEKQQQQPKKSTLCFSS